MSDISARLGLPYLLPSQAQKHVTHNEALRRLDALVQLAVSAFGAETPPVSPAEGEAHVLGAAPSGAWAGQAGRIAVFAEGAWDFFTPAPGWRVWDATAQELRVWDGAAWGAPQGAAETFGVNTSADGVNRLAVAAEAVLFTHDGDDHRLKLNKAADGDTATLLMQSGFTGHAEMGLAGNTDFALKVSGDGSAWNTALSAAADTGVVALPEGLTLGAGSDRLEVYESAAWSPELADAASGGNTATASTASGRYLRLGDQLCAFFALENIDTAGLTGGNDLFIRGLPEPARSHASSRFTAPVRLNRVSFASAPFLYLAGGESALRLMQNVPGGNSAFLDVAALTSGTADIYGSLTYRV